MNTYQSPYVEGQVLGAEGAETEREGQQTHPLITSQTEAKINGCTKTASDCLHKTTKLARELNHGTVSAAHLVLAMTLIPNASRQFDGKVDVDKAFRAAMLALMDVERGSPVNGALPSLSAEFKTIVTLAQDLARKREQEVSVDDLLNALDRLPSDSPAAQIIRGEPRSDPGIDAGQALDRLASLVNQQFQEIRRQIDAIRLDTLSGEISRLKSYLETRDGALEQQIRSGFADTVSRLQTDPQEALHPVVEQLPNQNPKPFWEMFFGNGSRPEPGPATVATPVADDSPPSPVRWAP
ncbi:MAG: hypothetical protein AB7V13_19360 [Pseudorhodoplanes sp.]|uniref:hypothetical protein n=1 Tax=Pseudorhodoplanes sp. TaxID=1934341 RepID=UPI003D0EB219